MPPVDGAYFAAGDWVVDYVCSSRSCPRSVQPYRVVVHTSGAKKGLPAGEDPRCLVCGDHLVEGDSSSDPTRRAVGTCRGCGERVSSKSGRTLTGRACAVAVKHGKRGNPCPGSGKPLVPLEPPQAAA